MKRKLFWFVAILITPLLLIIATTQALSEYFLDLFSKFEYWCFDAAQNKE